MPLKILNVTLVNFGYFWQAIYVYNKLFMEGEMIDWPALCRQYVVHISATIEADSDQQPVPEWLSEVRHLKDVVE
jgi:hypothetical protein